MSNHSAKSSIKHLRIRSDGYVLPLVIITGVILTIGAVILSTRSFSGLIRSNRQKQGNEATELAETGASLLINELNDKFPYLLTVNCQVENNSSSQQLEDPVCTGWKTFNFGQYGGPNSACPRRSTNPSEIMDLLYKKVNHKNGAYRLRNYEFLGDQVQGGKAIIQVQGQRFRGSEESSEIAASAIVEQEITIVPKCCDALPYQQCDTSKGYGLVTENIALGVGDIIDEDRNISESGANLHCSSCEPPPTDKCVEWEDAGQKIPYSKMEDCRNGVDITEDMVGVIDGKRSNGSIEIPDADQWDIESWGAPEPITIGWDPFKQRYYAPKFNHADEQGPHPNIKGCYTEIKKDGKKTTHCRIQTITASGQSKLDIDPGDGDIRFYVEGQTINLSGDHFIMPEDAKFGQFVIFGGASTWKDELDVNGKPIRGKGDKTLNFSGSGEINAFLHMPYFNINFSGGECWRPLIVRGAAITHGWNATGDCSQIRVPTDAGETICEDYGVCFSSSTSGESDGEFAALGSNQWSLIQMEQQ